MTKENGLYVAGEHRESLFSNRVERLLLKTIQPDAFFCIDNKPLILFFENLGNEKEAKLRDIWNFNESPIIIISESDSVEIYNGFKYLTDENTLELFGKDEALSDFSYFELVTGNTWEKHQKGFESTNRIDYHLLENIKSARDILISKFLSPELTNSLIGKVIFVRYLIDRKIKLDFEQRGQSRIWSNSDFCSLLSDKIKVNDFFNYLKEKFNGDLFPITKNEIDDIPKECLDVLVDLLSGDKVGLGQRSLFDLYDFSIIPVEFISNVYELFIGQVQQEEQGAYYTPLFLVDYILAETVEKKISKDAIYSCKVLDPSCGSGIFLVETLRKIIEQYQKQNPNYLSNHIQYTNDLKHLALDNIFGVDKDRSAINVAIFSIYLTLLDYQTPSDIESFRFPVLLNNNFFASDFFDQEANFNEVFREKDFDFILGNPPWKGNGIGQEGKKYLKDRLNREKDKDKKYPIAINNGEIVEGFIFRVSDFSSHDTKTALIVRSTILYNKGYSEQSKFRQYLLEEFYVDRIFELAPVRFEVFDRSNDPAVAPAAVLFYRYAHGLNTDDNTVEHITLKPSRFFSLFKVFSISRPDYKKLIQIKLKKYDWLWKTLVYGSYLDFNFIARLKADFKSLKSVLANKKLFKKGTGVKLSKTPLEDTSHLIGKPFIDSRDIEPFWANTNELPEFTLDKVGRKRDLDLFKGTVLLVRNGLDTHLFKPRAAIVESDIVYKNSLTGIKPISGKAKRILKNISANLYSDLYPYIAIHTFCSIGIEREQTKEYEKFDIPYVDNSLDEIVNEISRTKDLLYSERQEVLINNAKVSSLKKVVAENLKIINQIIFEKLSINENSLESSLIDYALNVSRPLITKDKDPLIVKSLFGSIPENSQYLEDYSKIFFDRFNCIYEKLDKKLIVEIKHTDKILGLFFKLVPLNSLDDSLQITKLESSSILSLLSSIGVEKITDRLFIQKDVRGFEKDGFYIIKPNEQRLWHKAMAHFDVNEFMDAILVSGSKGKSDVS
ncbi:Eco57I restriction-modification methylase domain-containing protein [Colwellia sp. RSH04]|uniref:Eco57I restriction-modification methylase domain-containing protein n=1 Tax=Colwellia sp. RSH04 TaxID=2305464 RepID=UPI0015F9F6FA|nr:N-6 DNA methylase [Colwellia sp. RSH04]